MNKIIVTLIVLTFVLSVSSDSYDYIVIGGGTAGSTAAAELSSDPNRTVLVLERGDDNSNLTTPAVALYNSILVGVGLANLNKFQTSNYFLKSRKSQENNLNFRSLDWADCPTLGGCSTLNGNACGRPSANDLERFNNPLWTYNETLDDWKSMENCHGSSCNPAFHGTGGPLNINTFTFNSHLTAIKAAAGPILGAVDNPDMNGPVSEGIGALPRNIDIDINGVPKRQDSYTVFLKPVLGRSNLVVLSGAKVTKFNLKMNGKHEVEYIQNDNIYKATARYDVFLTSGVFGNYKILSNSEIGDCDHFATLGLGCQVNNTHIGKNFRDSTLMAMLFVSPVPPQNISPGEILVSYYKSPIYTGTGTDMEVAFSSVGQLSPGLYGTVVQMSQLRHSSVGEVKLFSKNYESEPLVTFNFYSNPLEVVAMRDLIKKVRQIMFNLTLSGIPQFEFTIPGRPVLPLDATDAQIDAFIVQNVGTEGHFTGTCSMNTVVDGEGRLLNQNGDVVNGIVIADNSIVPIHYSSHCTACGAMLIGKRMARLAKLRNSKK